MLSNIGGAVLWVLVAVVVVWVGVAILLAYSATVP